MKSASGWWCAVIVLLALTGCSSDDTRAGVAVLPPDAGPFFQHLLPASELTKTLDIELRGERALYRFKRGTSIAEFELRHPSTCTAPDGPLCVQLGRTEGAEAEALAAEARSALTDSLHRTSDAPPWKIELYPSHRPKGGNAWLWIAQGFLLALLGGVGVALWRSRRSFLSRDVLPPALLTLLALVLRFIAHAGPADIRPVLEDRGPQRVAWDALLHLLFAVFPHRDESIWTVNRIVGAACVPLLYAVLKRRFSDPLVAVAGATALAVTPLLVRFAASDTPYTLVCAAFLGAIVAYDRFRETASPATLALALGLLAAAMQLRPDAPWLAVPAALLALAQPAGVPRRAWRPSPAIIACALLFVVINAVPTLWALAGHVEGGHLGQHFVLVGSLIGSPWTDPEMTTPALAALVILGACVVVFRHRKNGLLWLAATMVALPLDAPATGKFANLPKHRGYAYAVPLDAPVLPEQDRTSFHQYANARYHLPAMYLACGLAGAGSAGLLALLAWLSRRRIPAARLVACGVVAVAALPNFDLLQRMWTPQREFELFRENVSRLDPRCQVVTMIEVRDAGWVPFEYLASGKVVDAAAFLAQSDPAACTFYYRAGNCFTRDLVPSSDWPGFVVNPVCRRLEQSFDLIPIAETAVAALPYRGEIYTRDPLPLGFYRLQPRASGVAPPVSSQR